MPISQGDIIHSKFVGISHGKFFIIISIPANPVKIAFVFINSDINPNKFPTSRLKELHYQILKANYGFLTHDSYVDCSEIKEEDYAVIDSLITAHPKCFKGRVNGTDLREIMNKLGQSEKLTPKLRIKYGI